MTHKSLQVGKVRYWALILSLAVHSATLAVFTGVKLSGRISEDPMRKPVMNLQMIECIVEQPKLKPKPHIEPVQTSVKQTETKPPLITDPQPPEPKVPDVPPVSFESQADEPIMETDVVNEVEFFGQKSIVQHICYVVDCSGSMYGRMYLVRDQLKQSILNLNSQQAFSIVFFKEGQQIHTTGDGTMQAATAQAKSNALRLIESIRPSGSTDAEHAIQWAMKLKDAFGNGPEVFYFLSDGFDLDSDRSRRFVNRIEHEWQKSAPGAVLHTIGFGPQPQDRRTLRLLAEKAGGEFIEVKEN